MAIFIEKWKWKKKQNNSETYEQCVPQAYLYLESHIRKLFQYIFLLSMMKNSICFLLSAFFSFDAFIVVFFLCLGAHCKNTLFTLYLFERKREEQGTRRKIQKNTLFLLPSFSIYSTAAPLLHRSLFNFASFKIILLEKFHSAKNRWLPVSLVTFVKLLLRMRCWMMIPFCILVHKINVYHLLSMVCNVYTKCTWNYKMNWKRIKIIIIIKKKMYKMFTNEYHTTSHPWPVAHFIHHTSLFCFQNGDSGILARMRFSHQFWKSVSFMWCAKFKHKQPGEWYEYESRSDRWIMNFWLPNNWLNWEKWIINAALLCRWYIFEWSSIK